MYLLLYILDSSIYIIYTRCIYTRTNIQKYLYININVIALDKWKIALGFTTTTNKRKQTHTSTRLHMNIYIAYGAPKKNGITFNKVHFIKANGT
jgi:hypothetical protein